MASAAGLMNFLRTMAGAIGASIAVTIWDDHSKVARSELVGKLNVEETQNTLISQGMSSDSALGYISSLVDKEALTLSANHLFLILAMVFVFAALIVWLAPRPKAGVGGMPSH
jgi:DHA2 family multidrug resistance protein